MSSGELESKVSLVTGASRGIGKAVALKLSSLGSKIAINHIAPEKANADSLVQTIAGQGGEAMAGGRDPNAGRLTHASMIAYIRHAEAPRLS